MTNFFYALILFAYKNLFITKTKSYSLTKACCIKNSVVIEVGGSVSKLFTIENTGSGEAYASISWKELQNTYQAGTLVYTLEESRDNGLTYTEKVSETNVPTSNSNLYIVENLTIPEGSTRYYKLTITFKLSDTIDQTVDVGAYLNTLFTLEEGSFIDKALLKSKSSSKYWSSSEYADKIKTATFVQGINIPNDAIVSWDMSTAGDGRIMAYLVNNEDAQMILHYMIYMWQLIECKFMEIQTHLIYFII